MSNGAGGNRAAQDGFDSWREYWQAQGMPWRTEPEIGQEQQRLLGELLTVPPNVKQGLYPFVGLRLYREDVEWLIVSALRQRGDSGEMTPSLATGLDLRGADLHEVDLHGLPLQGVCGSLSADEWPGATPKQRETALVHLEQANLHGANLDGAQLRGARLDMAMLSDARLEQSDLYEAHLEQAYLRAANLTGADLRGAHLDKADLRGAVLIGANLTQAELGGATLAEAKLEKAILSESSLVFANLVQANLRGARLDRAKLIRANLPYARLEGADLTEAELQGADLRHVSFDAETDLENALLANWSAGPVALGDIRWGGVELTVVDWGPVRRLGDDNVDAPNRHELAARAYRQLAVRLRERGIAYADRFAYLAHVRERKVLLRRYRVVPWLSSWCLDVLAGYGYRAGRTMFWYLVVILGFAFAYFQATRGQFTLGLHVSQVQPLQWYEALVLSVSAFHGRGFFQPVQSLGDPVAILAAAEAVLGLFIEISFIATFTQRYFGK